MSSCSNGIKWINSLFGDCIVTKRDQASFAIGLISTVFSLLASLPQIISNFKCKTVEGISPIFPSLLVFGDIFSMVGGFITGILATQIFTAIVYLICDSILLIQWVVYHFCYVNGKYKNSKKVANENSAEVQPPVPEISNNNMQETPDNLQENSGLDPEDSSQSLNSYSRASSAAGIVLVAVSKAKVDYKAPYKGSNLIGTIFGWCSGIIYTSSRIPQLIKNFKNHKVVDLNPLYFIIMFLANLFYVISILVRDTSPSYIWLQLPFMIGALGPICCDGCTLIQALIFGIDHSGQVSNSNEEDEQEVNKDQTNDTKEGTTEKKTDDVVVDNL